MSIWDLALERLKELANYLMRNYGFDSTNWSEVVSGVILFYLHGDDMSLSIRYYPRDCLLVLGFLTWNIQIMEKLTPAYEQYWIDIIREDFHKLTHLVDDFLLRRLVSLV